MHIGVDDTLSVVHSLNTTAANAHDVTEISSLLHGNETWGWGDAGYRGVEKRSDIKKANT